MMASFAVSASATFADADVIACDVAVDALASLGVINGYPDNTFRPTNLVTRGHMAKMVAYVMNGGKDAAASYGSYANDAFEDVAIDYTFANGIGYVVSKGIVSGYADGTFRAGNNVTGVAAAKMLLGALGYNAAVEGYENDTNWKMNVINDGEEAGLFAGLETIDLTANLTREQAAQMIWNALGAETVSYSSTGITITTSDGTVVNTGATTAESTKKTLVEKVYNGTISVETDGTDELGCPVVSYNLVTASGSKVLATSAATAVKTYSKLVDWKAVAQDLGCTGSKTVKVNGEAISTSSEGSVGANGTVLKVFAADKDAYTMVAIPQYVYTVAKADIVPAKAATLTDDAVAAYVLINGAKYETTELAEGDVVVYNVTTDGKADVVNVKLATAKAGTVTAYGTGYFRLDGVKYELAACADLTIGEGVLAAGAKTTVYVDEYGYVVAAIETPGAEQPKDVWSYGFVLDYASRAYAADTTVEDLLGSTTTEGKEAAEKVKLVTTDGEVVILDTNLKVTDENKDGKLDTTTFVGTAAIKGTLVKYTLTDDGLVAKIETVVAEAAETSFVKGTAYMGENLMTAKSIVVFAFEDAKGNPVYESYTGYANVPSFAEEAMVYAVDGAVVVAVVGGVYTTEAPAEAPAAYAYFASSACEAVYNTETKATEYVYSDVYLDGVKGTLTFSASQGEVAGLYTYTVEKGLAEIKPVTTKSAAVSVVADTYIVDADGHFYVGSATKYFEITKDGVVAATGVTVPTKDTVVSIVYVSGGATSAAKDAATVVYFMVTAK